MPVLGNGEFQIQLDVNMKNSLRLIFSFLVLINCHLGAQTDRNATATATTYDNDFVVAVTVTDGGAGYYYPPTVTFNGVGTGAGAYSVISNGAVSQIVVTNTGSGYTTAPTVMISAPTEGLHSLFASSAYVTVPDSASLNSTTNALTVECWFNIATAISDWNAIISKEADSYSFTDYNLSLNTGQLFGNIFTSPNGEPYPTGGARPTYPGWHHAAMEYDRTNYTIWLDGSRVFAATNFAGIYTPTANPLSIGCQNSGFREFGGYVTEVRISSSIRYTVQFSPKIRFTPDSNTVALYHFDEGGGTVAHDSSGNGNDGVVYGTSAWSTNVPTMSPEAINIGRAVYVSFSNLQIGTNYQLQISTNLFGGTWSSVGAPFTATNSVMTLSNYWNVDNWNQLFFQLLH